MLSSNEITTFTGEWPSEIVNCFQSIKIYYVPVKRKKKEKKSLPHRNQEAWTDLFLPAAFGQDVRAAGL